MDDTDEWFLHLDCADLRAFDMSLYDRLVRYPTEVRYRVQRQVWKGELGTGASEMANEKLGTHTHRSSVHICTYL